MASNIIQSCFIVCLRALLNFGVFFYGSHFLSTTGLGLLAQVFAYIYVLTAVFDSGYGFLLLRDLKTRGAKVLSEITTHKILINLIILLIALVLLFIFATNNLFLYSLATLTSVLMSLQNFFGVFCRANRKFSIESSALFVQCLLLGLLVLFFHAEISIIKILAIICFVRFVGTIFLYLSIKNLIVFKFTDNGYILRNSATYGLAIIFSAIYFQIDTIIIGNMVSIEAAGFHQNAMRLAVIGMMLMEVTNQVFQPELVNKYVNSRQIFVTYQRHVQGLYAALSMLICIILMYFSKLIIDLLYGLNYSILVEYIHLVCFVILLRAFGLTISLPISLDQSVWPRVVCVFLAAVVAFSLNFIFIGLLNYDWFVAFYISILVHLIVNACYFIYAKIKAKIDLGLKPFTLSLFTLLALSFSNKDSGLFLIVGMLALTLAIFYLKKINDYSH